MGMDLRFGSHREDDDRSSLESQPESPSQHGSRSLIMKVTSNTNSSHQKSSKAARKRVISIPITGSEGSRFKGEGTPLPSDSWAWRKYGQKPIKGSPFPRGYYRCSSSKGCPARKQVERSRDNPTMLVVTYTCEHNHPWPAPKNNQRGPNKHNPTIATTTSHEEERPENITAHSSPDPEPKEKCTESLVGGSGSGSGSPGLDVVDEFDWFMDMRMTPSTILESLTFCEDYYHHQLSEPKNKRKISIGDRTMFFPMREEDELLFSDLSELPECAIIFRPGNNNSSSSTNNGVAETFV
ncbi:hypothetical protein MLD38_021187 [Melastoma candidum]|uniref:Uncharacterized protein n=1 Tax=Melastoma candidum TaxID=119954 RepID=A0ACB9QEJ2_9MYRT|nr:hypothetical protein MLD38_021187 [Melastoma candidum]